MLFRPIVAGVCATLVGVGLQRFAYAPLLPAIVESGWLSGSAAGLVGAANLAGYLAGALGAGGLQRHCPLVWLLRAAMLVAAGCFALCALPVEMFGSFTPWFTIWRTLAGAAGGVLMGLAGPAVQAAVPADQRGFAGGAVFTGVGLGIMTGAAVVPALLGFGVASVWLGLAAATLVLTAVSWRLWPGAPVAAAATQTVQRRRDTQHLIGSYALSAAAATPHMLFWPDYIARGLGHGATAGAAWWFVYGAAAACGPSLSGCAADRFGAARAYAVGLLLQAIAAGLPLLSAQFVILLMSSVLAGATTVGCTALALARAREIAGAGAGRLWRMSTAAWGGAQAGTGFLLAWIFGTWGSHLPLFAVGLAAGIGAVALSALNRAGNKAIVDARTEDWPSIHD